MSLTWSYTAYTAMNNIANISLDSTGTTVNKYIIEPATQDSAGSATPASGTLTFKVSYGINTLSKASTFTLTFDTTIANSEQTVLLMKGIGDDTSLNTGFDDKSSSNHTITKVGSHYLGTHSPYNSGSYSIYFDGSGDYINLGDHNLSLIHI